MKAGEGDAFPWSTLAVAGMLELALGLAAVAWSRWRRGKVSFVRESTSVDEQSLETSLAWIILLFAGGLEIVWAVGLKYTDGFTRLWPTLITLTVAWLSFFLLAYVMRAIPVGTAYAVWTGIGAAGTAILGMVLYGEPAATLRIICIILIVAGIIGLKLSSSS